MSHEEPIAQTEHRHTNLAHMPLPNKPLSEYDDLDLAIVEARVNQIKSTLNPGPRKKRVQTTKQIYLTGFGNRLFTENHYH